MPNIISEELLPLFGFSGTVDISESSPVDPPSNIIRTSESWFVRFNWTTSGLLNHVMCGTWKLQVLMERMGGQEFNLNGGIVTEAFVSAPHNYSKTITFPPSTSPVPAGLYRVTVIITMTGAGGQPGPIAGYADLGLVQFYDSVIP